MNFYKCPICGNIITLIDGNENTLRCCGRTLEKLIENTTDAAVEKHVPTYEIEGENIKVTIGEVEHPMLEEHYIMFIAQVIDKNINIVKLKPNEKPTATFKYIKNSKIYEYCNLHGLWVKQID